MDQVDDNPCFHEQCSPARVVLGIAAPQSDELQVQCAPEEDGGDDIGELLAKHKRTWT